MTVYRHKETGALATVAGPARLTDLDRTAAIGVTWHDRFNTVGAFTPEEFRREFEPATGPHDLS